MLTRDPKRIRQHKNQQNKDERRGWKRWRWRWLNSSQNLLYKVLQFVGRPRAGRESTPRVANPRVRQGEEDEKNKKETKSYLNNPHHQSLVKEAE
ncbi:hypothetical protein MRB53_005728 [Persea americana]|uniref:Uncharacterized protein n=1 Tax=Persea americana TaxID=3435 RepID=A0ACC2ME84_PERAE|nr:hypothetical protein MRB53_005728 [Persea americana]